MTAGKANDERELNRLIDRMCDQIASVDELAALGHRLANDPAARDDYIASLELHARLAWQMMPGRPFSPEELLRYASEELAKGGPAARGERQGMADFPAVQVGLHDLESHISDSPSVAPFPALSTTHYPLPTNFVGGPVFSYMVATLILGMMLLGAWAYKITHFQPQFVKTPSPVVPSDVRPELVFVGRITGMKDCRWANPRTEAYAGASVPLNRRYALASGLMEITYHSGARVILEGPCTYEIESRVGGYLSLGKLTARIETRGDSHYPLSPLPSPLFSVRTPTAIITDLGTEFGVEVDKEGNTASHVFRGSVKVHVVGGDSEQKDVVLRENESVRVASGQNGSDLPLVLGYKVGSAPKFVRRMVEPPKLLDLLDIVAGGRGTGNRRERGIDPATGYQDTWFVKDKRDSDHIYHRVAWSPLIDGVFIPHVSKVSAPKLPITRLDSAGSTFDRFLEPRIFEGTKNQCTILGRTTGSIWARAADASLTGATNRNGWIYSLVHDENYTPEGRGILGLHANVGITFDLAAMRKMHDGARPARLRAKLGMGDGPRKYPDAFGVADLWIFIDGRLKWVRKDIRHKDGVIDVNVPLDAESRFLTIVSTNGSRGEAYDWIVLGDPLLQMSPTETDNE